MVAGLSTALDLAFTEIATHHTRVAFVSLRLGKVMGLDARALMDLYVAASLHDLGAIASPDRPRLAQFDAMAPYEHCRRGALFLAESEVLAPLARVLDSHHDEWAGPNPSGLLETDIPLASRVIHLADRVDILFDRCRPAIGQRDAIRRRIRSRSGQSFDPAVVEAFDDVSDAERFWRAYGDARPAELLEDVAADCGDHPLPSEAISPLAGMFSRVIDSRSPYTREHSSFVARVAVVLAASLGFDATQRSDLAVAALLHDIGKLGVPEALLLKAGPLDGGEREVMRRHVGQTDRVLRRIGGIGHIRPWASFHHERPDGRGYPFGLDQGSLPLGSQLVSVCDQFAALAQERPYRPALDRESIASVLGRAARGGGLNGDLVDLLLERFEEISAPGP